MPFKTKSKKFKTRKNRKSVRRRRNTRTKRRYQKGGEIKKYQTKFKITIKDENGVKMDKNDILANKGHITNWYKDQIKRIDKPGSSILGVITPERVTHKKDRFFWLFYEVNERNDITNEAVDYDINLVINPDPEEKNPMNINETNYFVSGEV